MIGDCGSTSQLIMEFILKIMTLIDHFTSGNDAKKADFINILFVYNSINS